MRKKIMGILVCMMLLATSVVTTIIDPERNTAEAVGATEATLDLNYIWNMTKEFANVTYKAYNITTDIPKGRSFGSKGGEYTINKILRPKLNDTLGADNVTIEDLGYLDYFDEKKFDNYSSIINLSDFQFTINTEPGCPSYPYPNPIPKTEMYVLQLKNYTDDKEEYWSQNFIYENVRIVPTDFGELLPYAGTHPDHYKTKEYSYLGQYELPIFGFVKYLSQNDPVPLIQFMNVFLLDDVSGAQGKLDQITGAEGVIVVDCDDQGIEYITDTSNCDYPVICVGNTVGNYIKYLLTNNNPVFVDLFSYPSKELCFTYNLISLWPEDEPFVLIDRIPDHTELFNAPLSKYKFTRILTFFMSLLDMNLRFKYMALWNYLFGVNLHLNFYKFMNQYHPNAPCKGAILYDSHDYHFTVAKNTDLQKPNSLASKIIEFITGSGLKYPVIESISDLEFPVITVNDSVGTFLENHCATTTLSGYSLQECLIETDEGPGAIGSNIYANITLDHPNPENKIAIISNRYDGMWGQTPGDSAVGGGIVLGIAKYLKENPSIKRKYNLTFLFTTGEENGFKGAKFHVDKHYNQNITCWLILDQLGFDQLDTGLSIFTDKTNEKRILEEILKDSQYPKYPAWVRKGEGFGSEQGSVLEQFPDCNCICMFKGDYHIRLNNYVGYIWDHWHRAGCNYAKGDNMDNIDRDDVNASAMLVWQIVKYFMLNPDCGFNSPVNYTAVDSDADSFNDSIRATFSVASTMPSDKVRVKAELLNSNDYIVLWKDHDFNVTSTGTQKTITITLPPSSTGAAPGEYRLRLKLYNSTGRINDIISLLPSDDYNETDTWNRTVLLHPRGNTNPNKPSDISGPTTLQVYHLGNFSTSTTDLDGDFLQYEWIWEYRVNNFKGPYPSGDTCYREKMFFCPGWREIKVRAREDFLGHLFDGYNPLFLSHYGAWGPLSDSHWLYVSLFTSFNMACTSAASAQSATSTTTLPSVLNTDSIYEAVSYGGTAPLTYTWTINNQRYEQPEKIINYDFDTLGIKTVNLTVTDYYGYSANISANVTVMNLSASYNHSLPPTLYINPYYPVVFNDTSAARSGLNITDWSWDFGDGNISYGPEASHLYGEFGMYNVTLTVTDNESGIHECTKQVNVVFDDYPPEIEYVDNSPDEVGFGLNVSIGAVVADNISGIETVCVNITKPDNATINLTMTHVINDTYCCIFNDTWKTGEYTYSVWAVDHANNTDYATGFNFTVSSEATITVCTTKDIYTGNEFINLTDPPGSPSPSLGYELLDDGAVLHLWNQYDNYYFNTSSGIQLTNHKDEYWSHNVLMLGYYNNDQWNLLYRTDELTGFNRDIEIDENSYVNVTLWKDLSYAGYPFRLAIRYHLGVNDHDLTVIPYIKNLGTTSIPYVLGFGWELKDIQINMTTEGDYIMIDQESYYLNQTLENTYTDLNETMFYLMDDSSETQTQSLYLRWNPSLTYKLQVKSRSGQQNAPVTLFIQVGTLAVGQQKSTSLQWYDANQKTYYFDAFDMNEAWENDPELMTDETEETFASTRTDKTVELCNGNTCEGDDLGTIQKVELRANGYYEGKNGGTITLRPIFEETDGENYTFVTTDQPEWSQWFDITNDDGRGGRGGGGLLQWSWSEVNKLDCDVEASVGAETTLSCAMVQLRVTYNTAPSVSNPYPPHGTNGISLQPQLNITVSDPNGDTMNVTWYLNSTPSLLTLRPDANGSITELQRYPTSQNANYKCVDDTIVNDNDYVYWSGTSWKKDSYNLADHGSVSGVIHGVTIYALCKRGIFGMDPSVPNEGKIVIRSSGSYFYGNEFALTSTFTYYSHTWSVNPATGNAWNWSAIDALEAGIAFIGNEGGSSKCSQVYIVVNYTNPNTWVQFGQNISVSNGVYRQRFLNASVNGQWWYWKVKADDGTVSTWSSVYKFYTGYQSKIENTGETSIKGYLLMQVQYYNETTENWIVDNDTVNETTPRIINSSCQLGLDTTIFNGQVRASDLTHGTGAYRVYAAFRDPEGNILTTNDETELEAWWQFTKT